MMVGNRRHQRRALLAAALGMVGSLLWMSGESVALAAAADEQRIDVYMSASARPLASQARKALSAIESPSRRLLALRAYLRAGDSLPSRWSWSADEIASYARTPEYRQLRAAVEQVQARFEAQNPGYSLYANTDARGLEVQLERWNSNPAVGMVAQQLHSAAVRELEKRRYQSVPTPRDLERFSKFLHDWRPAGAVPLAPPGMSQHGRLRAIDFQIMKSGRIVAPTEIAKVASIWEAQGWTRKLRAATQGSGFVGPLRSPYEPWHYEYMPDDRQATQLKTNGTGARAEAATQ